MIRGRFYLAGPLSEGLRFLACWFSSLQTPPDKKCRGLRFLFEASRV